MPIVKSYVPHVIVKVNTLSKCSWMLDNSGKFPETLKRFVPKGDVDSVLERVLSDWCVYSFCSMAGFSFSGISSSLWQGASLFH